METQFSAWKKGLEKQLSEYDNAQQLLSNRDFSTIEEAEEKAEELRNNPDFCESVTGVFPITEDDETYYVIRGRKRVLRLRGLTKLTKNPNTTYGYQTDPENNLLISANILDAEWTDGGEDSDWYEIERKSIQILTLA